jgi:two-component system chemotaxis sensor kinase CheA
MKNILNNDQNTELDLEQHQDPIEEKIPTLANDIKSYTDILDNLMNLAGELVLIRNRILQISTKFNDVDLNKASQNLNLITSEIQDKIMKTRKDSSVSIIEAMIIESSGEKFVVPQMNVVELVGLSSEEAKNAIEKVGEAEFFRLRGEILPLMRLNEILGIKHNGQISKSGLNIVVLNGFRKQFGLIVDRVVDTEEIVIKSLNDHLKKIPYFSGATILGDGSVGLILNIGNLSLEVMTKSEGIADDFDQGADSSKESDDDLQELLLFTLSEFEMFAIPLKLVSRIEKISPTNIEVAGGKEVIRYRGSSMPIVRVDNFIGVSPPTEKSEVYIIVFELNEQNIGFYVSEIIDSVHVKIALDKDTFARPGLLGSSIIHDRVVLLLDVYSIIEMFDATWFTRKRRSNLKEKQSELSRILLVEDSQFWRAMEKSYLEAQGYSVITAENGEDGLEKLLAHQFDLVLVDLEMPVMDGFNLTRKIRENEKMKHLPIIAVTALTDEVDQKKAYECGVDNYILKLDKLLLVESVETLLKK